MAITRSNNYIPKDYEDLYRHYIGPVTDGSSLCRTLIRKMLPFADQDEKEILAHDVFLRIQEKEQLKKYDPTKANFGGVIFYVTRSIVVNHLAAKSRNPITGLCKGTLVEQSPDDETFEPGVYSLERLFEHDTIDLDSAIDAHRMVTSLITWAKALAADPKNKREESILPMLERMMLGEDPKIIAIKLEVTASTVHNWMEFVRDHLGKLGHTKTVVKKVIGAWSVLFPKTDFDQARATRLEDQLKALEADPRHKRDASLHMMYQLLNAGEDIPAIASQLRVASSTINGWIGEVRRMAIA